MRAVAHMPHNARVRALLGWCRLTPPEWIVLAVIVAMVYWGAAPHYGRWRRAHLAEEEQLVVTRVRSALVHQPRVAPGADTDIVTCPADLDTCADGVSAADCPFFHRVLGEPIRSPAWRKVDGHYVGPAGGVYRYEQRGCQFLEAVAPKDSS